MIAHEFGELSSLSSFIFLISQRSSSRQHAHFSADTIIILKKREKKRKKKKAKKNI